MVLRKVFVAAVLVLSLSCLLVGSVLAEDVKLTFTAWGGESHWKIYEKLAAVFSEQNDGITVEFIPTPDNYVDKLKTNVMAGTGPDIYFCQEMQTVGFIDEGWFIPLNDFIEKDDSFDISLIHSGLFSSFTWQDKIGAMPVVAFVSLLYYNPVKFNEAGLANPQSMTWDQLVQYAKALTKTDAEGNIQQYGHKIFLGSPNLYLYYLWQNEGGILDEERRNSILNTPETVGAVRFIYDLLWTHRVAPKLNELGAYWLHNHNLAMMTQGSWDIGYLSNQAQFLDFEVIGCPVGKREVNLAYPNAFGISAASKHPEEAWKFLAFLSGPEGQRIIAEEGLGTPVNTDPSVADAYFTGPTMRQRMVAVQALAKAQAPRVVPGMQGEIIDQRVNPFFIRVWNDELPPESAAEQAHRQVQSFLDEFYNQ